MLFRIPLQHYCVAVIRAGQMAKLERLKSKQSVTYYLPHTASLSSPVKQWKTQVRFRPGLPEKMKEIIVIEAGHFDPVELPVYGEGVYAAVAVSLPRDTSVTPWGQPVSEEPGQVNISHCLKVCMSQEKKRREGEQ